MTLENHKRVRAYLMTGPGLQVGYSSQDVLRKAWGLSGIGGEMSLGTFIDSLHALAFRPDQLGSQWVLRLPDGVNK